MKIGPYKVAYWDPSEPKTIYSEMFDKKSEAIEAGKGLQKDGLIYTIMKIRMIADGAYTWELLEEGVGYHLPLLSQLYKYKSPLLLAAAAITLTRWK